MIDKWLETLKSCKCIPEKDLKTLCEMARDILIEEANIQPVQSPVIVCGDIHGQFHDLMELFRVGGELPKCNYVFMVFLNIKYYREIMLTVDIIP